MNTADKEELDEFIAFVNAMEKNKKQPKKKTVKKTVDIPTDKKTLTNKAVHNLSQITAQALANSIALSNGEAPPEISTEAPTEAPAPPRKNRKEPPSRLAPPRPASPKASEAPPAPHSITEEYGEDTGSVLEDVYIKSTRFFNERNPEAHLEGEDTEPNFISHDRMAEIKRQEEGIEFRRLTEEEINKEEDVEKRLKKHQQDEEARIEKERKEKEAEEEEEENEIKKARIPKALMVYPQVFIHELNYLIEFDSNTKGQGSEKDNYYLANLPEFVDSMKEYRRKAKLQLRHKPEQIKEEIKAMNKAYLYVIERLNKRFTHTGKKVMFVKA